MKLFLGLIKPTSGVARLLGEETYKSVESRSRIGYMPENESLPRNVNASEFLMHMAQVSGLPPSPARVRSADMLRHVGLDEERYRPLGEYSTGMKQRVKLAQALVHDPVLVMLDEPTAGLDPAGREEMLRLIRRTATEFGISIMLSTHLMGDVERTADSVIVLESGTVSREGSVAKFTEDTETLLIEVTDKQEEFATALAVERRAFNRRRLRIPGGSGQGVRLRPDPRCGRRVRLTLAPAVAAAAGAERHLPHRPA